MKTPKILLLLFVTVLTFSSFTKKDKEQAIEKFIVVLDAGHGGKDHGNRGNGYKESEIALKIVLDIGKQLEKNPNIKVVYTRQTDVFVELSERGHIANKAKADLFVSVHCNAHNSDAHGTETFVLGTHRNQTNFEVAKKENSVIFLEDDYQSKYKGFDPNSPESVISILISQEEYLDQSIILAGIIQNRFTNKLKLTNRGVKQAGFIVLHQTVMPSVLIEVGFLTNKTEGAYLNSLQGQKDMANSITGAILEYKHSIEGSLGTFVFKEETASIPVKVVEPIPNVIQNVTPSKSPVSYKVQLIATSKAIDVKPNNFKGLKDVVREKENAFFKYFYGNTTNYENAKLLEEEAEKKGYKSCFIVAFKDGKKISITEALKTSTN